MQATPSTRTTSPTSTDPDRTTGILEDSHGVVHLICSGVQVAKVRKGQATARSDTFLSRSLKQEVQVVWTLVEGSLDWERIPALKRLQGASMQMLLEPCILLSADPRKEYAPISGADGVRFAIISKLEPEVPRLELFAELLRCVKDRLPFHPSL
jgi:hypothetical protein